MSKHSNEFDFEDIDELGFEDIDELSFEEVDPLSKGRKAYKNLKRDLSKKELASSGVQKMMLEDIERLMVENQNLQEFQSKYYQADTKRQVLEQKLNIHWSHEAIYTLCVIAGGALFTHGLNLSSGNTKLVFLGFGILLVICGILSRFRIK